MEDRCLVLFCEIRGAEEVLGLSGKEVRKDLCSLGERNERLESKPHGFSASTVSTTLSKTIRRPNVAGMVPARPHVNWKGSSPEDIMRRGYLAAMDQAVNNWNS